MTTKIDELVSQPAGLLRDQQTPGRRGRHGYAGAADTQSVRGRAGPAAAARRSAHGAPELTQDGKDRIRADRNPYIAEDECSQDN